MGSDDNKQLLRSAVPATAGSHWAQLVMSHDAQVRWEVTGRGRLSRGPPGAAAVPATLVSQRARSRAKTELSKPTRDSSPGTRTPSAAAADRAPTQVRSFAAKMAVGRPGRLISWTVAGNRL